MEFLQSQAVQLLTDLPEALLITTSSGEIVFFNNAAAKQSGFEVGEMLGKHVSHLLPESNRRKVDVVTWLSRWADNPDPEQLRYLTLSGIRKDGAERRYQVRVSRFDNKDETCFVIVLRDVTEEQEQTAELRHAQLISNRIIAIGEDAVLSIDPAMNICFWNQKAEELFGYSEKEIMGQSVNLLVPEAARKAHSNSIGDFGADKAPSKFMGQRGEILGQHKSGRLIPLEASITKTYIGNRLIMSAQVRDISARKKAQRDLEEREARFGAVFDHAVEAIALLDAEGLVLEINSAARKMLPQNESVQGKHLWELGWWGTPDSSERAEAEKSLHDNVVEAAAGTTVRTRSELETSHGILDIDFSLIPVTNESGEVKYLIAEARNLIETT